MVITKFIFNKPNVNKMRKIYYLTANIRKKMRNEKRALITPEERSIKLSGNMFILKLVEPQ